MVYKTIPKSVIERVPLYFNYINKIDNKMCENISSTTISQELGLGEVLVRKDLNIIAGNGKPKIGYQVSDLKSKLITLINNNKIIDIIIVGVGKIGEALVKYQGFEEKGFHIKQIFDCDKNKIGKKISDYQVNSIDNLSFYCKQHNIQMAIISVNSDNAQEVCDNLISSGVKGILNFTNTLLVTSNNVSVRNVDIASQLMMLSLEINNK